MYVHTGSAIGETKPKSAGVLPGTLRIIAMMLKARFDSRYKQTPFFNLKSGNPVVVPKVLNDEELKNAKRVV